MHWNDPKRAFVLLAAMLMASCASVTKPQAPPWYLLEPCVAEQPPLRTNADLLITIGVLRSALRSCNDDKAALREWAEKQ